MGKPAEIKTKQTSSSVKDFLDSIVNEQQQKDCRVILGMMETATGEQPRMWGNAIIGFGEVRYKSPSSGREVDWLKMGFSPRKANISLNLIDLKKHAELLSLLGKHKAGMGCLYINALKDVDLKILEKIIQAAAFDTGLSK